MKRWNVLIKLINEYELKTFVEVGVKAGRNIKEVVGKCHDVVAYGVDPWEKTPAYESWKDGDFIKSESRFDNLVSIYSSRVYKLKMLSKDAVRYFDDGSVDLVFIDGDHTYEGARLDIELWLPKVRVGGVIAGHDIDNVLNGVDRFPGVRKAVEEFFPSFELAADHVWWVRKC